MIFSLCLFILEIISIKKYFQHFLFLLFLVWRQKKTDLNDKIWFFSCCAFRFIQQSLFQVSQSNHEIVLFIHSLSIHCGLDSSDKQPYLSWMDVIVGIINWCSYTYTGIFKECFMVFQARPNQIHELTFGIFVVLSLCSFEKWSASNLEEKPTIRLNVLVSVFSLWNSNWCKVNFGHI